MKKIRAPLSVLGQARGQANSNHIDGSVQKELGWGGNSFTLGAVTYGSIMIRQHCAVYISEKSLIIMSVSDGDSVVSRMSRHTREEQTWELDIGDIKDVQVLKGEDLTEREFVDDNKERMRQRCAIRIKRSPELLLVDTYDCPQFSRHLLWSWHSCSCARAAGLPRVNATSNPQLARDYLNEVISCYASTRDLKEKIEILDEVSDEVLHDLELKDAIFRHRELIVLVLSSCHKALNAPSGYEEEVEAKLQQYKQARALGDGALPSISPTSAAGNTFNDSRTVLQDSADAGMRASDSETFLKVSYDRQLQSKLEQTVMNRMLFFHASLRFFVSLLFLSESVGSRSNAITESDPLSPSAWLEFCAPDLFDILCRRLHCNMKARHDLETQENLRETVGEAPSPFVSVDLTDSFSSFALSSDATEHSQVSKLIRSVADYQIMVTVELCRVASLGIQEHKIGMSRTHNRINLSRNHIPICDLWIRQINFDVTLEALLARIAALLDDIVLTERRKRIDESPLNARRGKAKDDAIGNRLAVSTSFDLSQDAFVEAAASKGHTPLRRIPSVPPSPGKGIPSGTLPAGGMFGGEENSRTPTRGANNERRMKAKNELSPNPKLDPLVPSKPGGKAEVTPKGKRDSFVMLNHDHLSNKPDVAYDTHGDLKPGVLETQEVLLYYSCQLLRHLTYDSAKAREVLGNECQALWPPIKVILDIICPRQEGLRHPGLESSVPSLQSQDAAPKRGIGAFLKQCFRSSTLEVEPKENKFDEYQAYDSLALRALHDTPQMEAGTLPWLPITDYGPARIHVNKQAWELLVLSRRCIDECMDIMGLHATQNRGDVGTRVVKTVAANGKVLMAQVRIEPPPRDITLEMTPRLATQDVDVTDGKKPTKDSAVPQRPPRRPRPPDGI